MTLHKLSEVQKGPFHAIAIAPSLSEVVPESLLFHNP